MTISVNGFKFSAVKAKIRGKDRLDLGLICCDTAADIAAVFTSSSVKAAPVLLGMERVKAGKGQAIMINSGVANACTGDEGMKNARACAALAASALNISEELVLVSSTGVIGEQLELACFENHAPLLVKELDKDKIMDVAKAIMTTDTVHKLSSKDISIGGTSVRVAGMAKGAGMIMPNMATMLCFLMTDANVSSDVLKTLLKNSVDKSFNRITVDGDTSTNDSAIILANGMAAHDRILKIDSEEAAALQKALDEVTFDLAMQIVADGEGATKLVSIKIDGARSQDDAEKAARTIANSCLVKTAFFGQDANWGRIIAALGRSGAIFNQEDVHISFDNAQIVENGLWKGKNAEEAASKVLAQDSFSVLINLQAGPHCYEIYTCDLSLDYVRINADYRS